MAELKTVSMMHVATATIHTNVSAGEGCLAMLDQWMLFWCPGIRQTSFGVFKPKCSIVALFLTHLLCQLFLFGAIFISSSYLMYQIQAVDNCYLRRCQSEHSLLSTFMHYAGTVWKIWKRHQLGRMRKHLTCCLCATSSCS